MSTSVENDCNTRGISVNPDDSISITINDTVESSIKELVQNGTENYFLKLKEQIPAIPSRDLVIKDLNYSIKVSKKSESQEVTNFVKDFVSMVTLPFTRAYTTKDILKNINLDLHSGTTTIVFNNSFLDIRSTWVWNYIVNKRHWEKIRAKEHNRNHYVNFISN